MAYAKGDRVILLTGDYATWHGTIGAVGGADPALDQFTGLSRGRYAVALDGECGAGKSGGRGGRPVVVCEAEMRPESADERGKSQAYVGRR